MPITWALRLSVPHDAVTPVAYVELYEVRPLAGCQVSRLCECASTAPTGIAPSWPRTTPASSDGAADGWLSEYTRASGTDCCTVPAASTPGGIAPAGHDPGTPTTSLPDEYC